MLSEQQDKRTDRRDCSPWGMVTVFLCDGSGRLQRELLGGTPNALGRAKCALGFPQSAIKLHNPLTSTLWCGIMGLCNACTDAETLHLRDKAVQTLASTVSEGDLAPQKAVCSVQLGEAKGRLGIPCYTKLPI